jgi:hypothetical protein
MFLKPIRISLKIFRKKFDTLERTNFKMAAKIVNFDRKINVYEFSWRINGPLLKSFLLANNRL